MLKMISHHHENMRVWLDFEELFHPNSDLDINLCEEFWSEYRPIEIITFYEFQS